MTSNKQKKKGKTVSLAEFLDGDSKIVPVRSSNWSEIVDREEETTNSKSTLVDLGALPTAPRAALEATYNHISQDPPFVACATNLSFQIDDEALRRIFADLNPKSARILCDNGRSRGIGLVEFETRDQLIEALKRTDKELYGRTIRVHVSDKTDSHHSGGRHAYKQNRNEGEDRPEMDKQWERGIVRSDNNSDRKNRGFNRDGPNRNDFSRQNQRGPRDHQESNSFGYGYPRTRDDRGGHGGNRDHNNRPSQRFRHHDDELRPNSGTDRPRYSGRHSDTHDVRDRPRTSEEPSEEQREAPRERPRLHLQPRTKPLDPEQTVVKASSTDNTADPSIQIEKTSETSHGDEDNLSNNDHQEQSNEVGSTESSAAQKAARGAGSEIFGGAKPVDTLAKELEIEKKLKEMELSAPDSPGDDHHEKQTSRSSYTRTNDRDNPRGKRSSHNEDHHPRDRQPYRRDDGRSDHGSDYHHRREHSGGKQYEEDSRRRNDDDHYRRGGGERFNGTSRRDNDSARSNKYQHHNQPDRDHDRGNFRHRDRDNRHNDSNESNNQGRSSNNFNTESQPRSGRGQNSGMNRRVAPAQETGHRLELSNKFVMLDDDDLDAGDDNEEPQSPTIDN